MQLNEAAATQASPLNPIDKRREEEYSRILHHQAKVRERALVEREAEADYINDILRHKIEHAKPSYDTNQFSVEYGKRRKKAAQISKAKRNTAESFILGASSRGGGVSNGINMSRLAKSCPDFSTNAVGTFGRGQLKEEQHNKTFEENLFNGRCAIDRESFGRKVTPPRSAPAAKLCRSASRPRSAGVRCRGSKSKGTLLPHSHGTGADSPELLRSLTKERLKDIERVERVLRGLKDDFKADADLQKQLKASPSSRNLSDLSGDDQPDNIGTVESPSLSPVGISATVLNPLMKLKLKAIRIRKVNAHLCSLISSAADEEASAAGEATFEKQERRAVWNLTSKRQRIRKINKYLMNLQNSISPDESEVGQEDMTKEELEELERVLSDMPDPLADEAPAITDSCPPVGNVDVVALPHVKIGYGYIEGMHAASDDAVDASEDDNDARVSRRDLLSSDRNFTEFGIPADESMMAPIRENADDFMMCTDAFAGNSNIHRDIYKLGSPRCAMITECSISCVVNDKMVPAHRPDIVDEMNSIANLEFSLRISDVGLSYPMELLHLKRGQCTMQSPKSRLWSRNDEKVLTSTGVLIELIGPVELETIVGSSKQVPWQFIENERSKAERNKHRLNPSNSFQITSPSRNTLCNKSSPIKTRSDLSDIMSNRDPVVVSRHFLSIAQLHALSSCDFSASLHKKLGILKVFDSPARDNSITYGYDSTNLPLFSAPGMLYECLSTYMDNMGKGLLLEMILSCLEPTVSLINAGFQCPIGLGAVQYLNSCGDHTAGIAIRNEVAMDEDEHLRIAVYFSFG